MPANVLQLGDVRILEHHLCLHGPNFIYSQILPFLPDETTGCQAGPFVPRAKKLGKARILPSFAVSRR